MTCRLWWYVEMETRYRIPIWRTFGRIQWHIIPQPRVTLQGAATWWIHYHDSRAACHTAGCSHLRKSMSWSCHIAGCKNSIRHTENLFSPYVFFVLMQFRLWRAAAFVSSPIHLFHIRSPDVSSIASIPWRDIVSNLFIHSFTLYFILLYFDFFVLIGSMLVTRVYVCNNQSPVTLQTAEYTVGLFTTEVRVCSRHFCCT